MVPLFFRVIPAVGFKAWHTDVRYPPWGTSDILTHCVGYITIHSRTKAGGGWGWWWVKPSSAINFAESVCVRWKGLKLTAKSVYLRLIGPRLDWTECPARTSDAHGKENHVCGEHIAVLTLLWVTMKHCQASSLDKKLFIILTVSESRIIQQRVSVSVKNQSWGARLFCIWASKVECNPSVWVFVYPLWGPWGPRGTCRTRWGHSVTYPRCCESSPSLRK